jgi:hypothetical protein
VRWQRDDRHGQRHEPDQFEHSYCDSGRGVASDRCGYEDWHPDRIDRIPDRAFHRSSAVGAPTAAPAPASGAVVS